MPISPISTRLFCARTESGCVGDFPGFSDLNQDTCNSKYNTNVPVWLSANLVENTSQLDGSSMFIMIFSPEIAGTTHFQDITLWWLKTVRHWKWPLSSMIYLWKMVDLSIAFWHVYQRLLLSGWAITSFHSQVALTCCCANCFKSCSKCADTPMAPLTFPRPEMSKVNFREMIVGGHHWAPLCDFIRIHDG